MGAHSDNQFREKFGKDKDSYRTYRKSMSRSTPTATLVHVHEKSLKPTSGTPNHKAPHPKTSPPNTYLQKPTRPTGWRDLSTAGAQGLTQPASRELGRWAWDSAWVRPSDGRRSAGLGAGIWLDTHLQPAGHSLGWSTISTLALHLALARAPSFISISASISRIPVISWTGALTCVCRAEFAATTRDTSARPGSGDLWGFPWRVPRDCNQQRKVS